MLEWEESLVCYDLSFLLKLFFFLAKTMLQILLMQFSQKLVKGRLKLCVCSDILQLVLSSLFISLSACSIIHLSIHSLWLLTLSKQGVSLSQFSHACVYRVIFFLLSAEEMLKEEDKFTNYDSCSFNIV